MTPKEFKALPLSEAIAHAIEDVKRISNTPGYRLGMSRWHYRSEGTCAVCLGGAVLIGLEGCQTDVPGSAALDELFPDMKDTGSDEEAIADTFNALRLGELETAVSYWSTTETVVLPNDYESFHGDLDKYETKQLINQLQSFIPLLKSHNL